MAEAPGAEASSPTAGIVEIITDQNRVMEEPFLTIRTGLTNGQTFYIRINQPQGRALLIALHL
jgi:hypothetical protein